MVWFVFSAIFYYVTLLERFDDFSEKYVGWLRRQDTKSRFIIFFVFTAVLAWILIPDSGKENFPVDEKNIGTLIPCTLEGCVMRICDIIAYLGKDRQDAMRLGLLREKRFSEDVIGSSNAEIINNFTVNLIENSYGKPYLKMDEDFFTALRQAKIENYQMIYNNKKLNDTYENEIRPMFGELYEELLRQAESGDKNSIFYRHHMAYVAQNNFYTGNEYEPYESQEKNQLVVDFLASVTDRYFIELYHYLFPKGKHDVKYTGYF